jgi:predicted dehydrogenase
VKTYIGVLGAGNISQTHLRAAREIEGVEVVAVGGRSKQRVADLASEAGARSFTKLEDFLKSKPLDVVLIGSPSGLHAEQGIEAARHGLHVLTEKPLDITTDRADALIRACDKAKVHLGVFFQDRVAADLETLKGQLDEGLLGKPLLVSAQVRWYRDPEYYSASSWRGTWALDGGGALMNQGVHTVDLLLWLLGDVRRVFARTGTFLHDIETEDTAVALLEFSNGTMGTLEAATSAYPGYPRRVALTTTEGTITIEQDRVVSLDLRQSIELPRSQREGDRNPSSSSAVVSDVRGHRRILEDFLGAIRDNRPPLCSGAEGRRSVELVQAVYRSALSGQPVTLD